MKAIFIAVCVIAGALAGGAQPKVCRIGITGAIGPATADYISRAVDEAHEKKAECLIIQLDTPGGLLDSTKVIVQKLLAAPVPVIVFVAPAGANAASAGCFITLAADVAAMVPGTNIGAAHPVGIGMFGSQEEDETIKQKHESHASSYVEAIAAKRNRNVEWAKSSVVKSASVTAQKALELKVIEIIANDQADLLRQLHGRPIHGRTFNTANVAVEEIGMTWGERIFQLAAHPQVMLILMLIALYGIIGELSNPGAILPGVVGAIALILALYLASIVPINLAGFALIVLAIILFVADVFTPTHGVLTVGGVVSFFLGLLMVFDNPEPAFRLSLAYIIPATLMTAAFFIFIVAAGLRAQWLPVKAGRETMIGGSAAALTDISAAGGKVMFEGEYWNAVSEVPVRKDQLVEVVGGQGLTLKVKPKTQTS